MTDASARGCGEPPGPVQPTRQRRPGLSPRTVASISSAKSFATTFRLSFSDGVMWPDSSVNWARSTRNFRTDSALETALLPSSTRLWSSASSSASSRSTPPCGRAGLPCSSAQRRQELLVDGEQRAHERAAVADDHALGDQRVRADAVLDHGGGDVLAARGHHDLLLAAGDGEIAVRVEGAEVAGVEPAVGERLCGGRLVVPVAGEQVLAVQQHLAVVGDPDHGARQRLADRADLLPVPRVEGGGRAGLGQPVALQHGEADAPEEVAEPLAQRGAAGDGVGGRGRPGPRAACCRRACRRPCAAA